jgi:hypothetical protein
MRSIRLARAILGEELLAEFARALEQRDLSPVSMANGSLHKRESGVNVYAAW